MTRTTEFLQLFARAVVAHGGRAGSTPAELGEQWSQFVDFVEEGYEDNIYEYRNDLAVRGLIEAVLVDPELTNGGHLDSFRVRVAEIDGRLRSLLRAEPVITTPEAPWWEAHIPAWAGAELAADLRTRYGVDVEVR